MSQMMSLPRQNNF